MGLIDRVKGIAVGPPGTTVVAPLGGDHVLLPQDDRGTVLEPEKSYYRIWVTEMSLAHGREWFTDWHPAFQLATASSAGEGDQFANLAGPVQIAGFTGPPGTAVRMEHALTPLLPFRGGTVSLTAGLIAVKGDSLVKTLINTVAGFGALLMNPEVVAGAMVATKVVDGIEAVLGIDADRLLLGMDRTYTSVGGTGAPNVFTSGYVAILDTPRDSIDPGHLWVRNGQLLHRPSTAAATSPPVSYALIWIETRPTREDWLSITSIAAPYRAAVSSYDAKQKAVYYRQAILAARTHPLLTEADQVAFADRLRTQAQGDGGLGATGSIPADLAAFAETVTMNADDALEAGTPLAALLDF